MLPNKKNMPPPSDARGEGMERTERPMDAVTGVEFTERGAEAKGPRTPVLTVADVSKEYETREGDRILALDHASLSLDEGEFVSVVGPPAAARDGRGVPDAGAAAVADRAGERAAAYSRAAAAAQARRAARAGAA